MNKNLNFQNLRLGIMPKEGLKALGMEIPISPSGYELDLVSENIKSQFSTIEMIFVDNADSAVAAYIFMGSTGQRIICPPCSQGYFFLLLPNPPVVTFVSTQSYNLQVQLLNFRMTPLVWNVQNMTVINPNQIALPDGKILVGNSLGEAAAVTMTGDAEISDTGEITVLSASDPTGFSVPNGPITPNQTKGIVGTNTNNNAQAGSVGEYIESIVLPGAAVALTNGAQVSIASIALGAGDWDVTAIPEFTGGNTTQVTRLLGSISTTNNTINSNPGRASDAGYNFAVLNNSNPTLAIPPARLSLAAPTTVYLVVSAFFTVSNINAYGIISARRVR